MVVVYKMADQALNTLYTLSADYQRDVSIEDYEVIVIENESDHLLGKEATLRFGSNFRYYKRPNLSPSPAAAINFGVRQAKNDYVCIMIDGARMVTPNIVFFTLCAIRITGKAVIAVPGYHLGKELQQIAVQKGYNKDIEKALLDSIPWRSDGYRLFDIACFSGTSAGGFFNPIAESNCLSLSVKMFNQIGGSDVRFDLPGGGFINLDMYKRACEQPEVRLFVLPGEGSFHQIHGGASTSENFESLQQTLVPQFHDQYVRIRGCDYFAPQNKPVYLGTISKPAQRFVKMSVEKASPENQ